MILNDVYAMQVVLQVSLVVKLWLANGESSLRESCDESLQPINSSMLRVHYYRERKRGYYT